MPTVRSSGFSLLHRACAIGQREWKGQPDGGSSDLVTVFEGVGKVQSGEMTEAEQKQMEITGANGGAIQIAPININALDYDERDALESMLANVLALPSSEMIDVSPVETDDDA